jgi:putative endonuclease
MNRNYHVYIITNVNKTVLYTGVTNDLKRRLCEHENGLSDSFTKKYKCYFLLYYEHFTNIKYAIAREKEIKAWRREKKIKLISSINPNWIFLNIEAV